MSQFKSATGAATTDQIQGVLPQSGTIVNLPAASGNTATYEFASAPNATGLKVVASVTTGATGSTSTVQIDGWDPASGTWVPILSGTGLTATGTSVYEVNPHITAATNRTAQTALHQVMRVYATRASGASAIILGFHFTA